MANDRIHIMCRHCKKYRSMAKYYPTLGHGVWFPESLSDFIERHMEHSPHFGGDDLGGDACFELFAESSDVWPEGATQEVVNAERA